ncbi:hypothetical protein CCHL11_06803, partial [Colletotrichum chlorophyti]
TVRSLKRNLTLNALSTLTTIFRALCINNLQQRGNRKPIGAFITLNGRSNADKKAKTISNKLEFLSNVVTVLISLELIKQLEIALLSAIFITSLNSIHPLAASTVLNNCSAMHLINN